MNLEQLEGRWTQLKGKAREQWAKLTDDDLLSINGKADQLIGAIQERYGKTKEEAKKEVNAFCERYLH